MKKAENVANNNTRKGHAVHVYRHIGPCGSVVQVEEVVQVKEEQFDEDFLHRLISDTGRWAYGTVIVEMWVLNQEQTALYRPQGGWWVDPVWHHCQDKAKCKVWSLSDPTAPGYQEPPPMAPGRGLAGVLWAESQPQNTRLSTLDERRTVIWKDLNALRLDPDQPFNSRIKQVGDVGLGYGGAVSFSRTNQKGIIIFVARAGVDLEKLRSPTNETYLRSASDLIASAFALRGPRRAAQLERKKELDAALRRARLKIQAMIRMGISLRHLAEKPQPTPLKQKQFFPLQIKDEMYGTSKTYMVKLWQRLAAMVKKSKGAGVAPSPPFTIRNSLHTFIGVSSIFLILTRMNSFIDDEYNMELCPFGALMTLQYSLTAAPASQPMNAVLGQAISLAIAIGIGSISGLDLWLRQSLATALAIMTMAKLGLTHPPAGAAALIFAGGSNIVVGETMQ